MMSCARAVPALALLSVTAIAVPVSNDPPVPLTNTTALAAAVLGMTNGPDLDLAYNDYLDLRIKAAAGSTGDISVFYGVANAGVPGMTGFSPSRMVSVPAGTVVRDGVFHTYRLYMGLEQLWRGMLTDFRVEAPGTTLETVRVGDVAAPVVKSDYRAQTGWYSMESKHFVFVWDEGRRITNHIDDKIARGNLRNAEEVRALFVHLLKFKEPRIETDGVYKVFFWCMDNGYWGGGTTFNIDPSGLCVDPPSWIIPHEFGHVMQSYQGGRPGEVWDEASANYLNEQYVTWYSNLFPEASVLEGGFADTAMYYPSHGAHYYVCWPILCYMEENPDNLPGLGFGMHANLWRKGRGETIYDILQAVVTNVSVKDVIGYYARRNVTWDYRNHAGMIKNVPHPKTAELHQRADDPAWWQVPPEMAPMQGGYTVQEIVPDGTVGCRTVTVTFHGLPEKARGTDWRASLVAVTTAGVARYSALWNAGASAFTVSNDEQELYLVVAATPDIFIRGDQDDSIQPYQSHPQRQRFLYEIQVQGGTPRETVPTAPAGCHAHANGGGMVAGSATVEPAAYVGPHAMVLDSAKVKGNARIEDYAVVRNTAEIRDNAIVSGHATVEDAAVVSGHAKVRDYARSEGGNVSGHARLLDHGSVSEAVVRDYATVKGYARQWKDEHCFVGGDAVMDGDHADGRTATNGFQYGHMPWAGDIWIDSRHAPRRVFAAYDFATPKDSIAKDMFGTCEGYLVGAPKWVEKDGVRRGFYSFDGGQYIILPRAVSDFSEIAVGVWVKPTNRAASQTVWCFGADSNRYVELRASDGSGRPVFTARNSGAPQTLKAAHAIPTGAWTHLAVALDGSNGVLYVNGKEAARGPVAIVPDQVLAANVNTARQQNYVGRGIDSGNFNGSLDTLTIYSQALGPDRMDELMSERAMGNGTGLLGEYYGASNLTKPVLTRVDPQIVFDWAEGSPAPGVSNDFFSIRWSGKVQPLYSDTYTFTINSDNGSRLWVDGKLLIDKWLDDSGEDHSGTIALEGGRKYDLVIEFVEFTEYANCKLYWSSPHQSREPVPQSQLYPKMRGVRRPGLPPR